MAYDAGFAFGILLAVFAIAKIWSLCGALARDGARVVRAARTAPDTTPYEHPVYRQIRERRHR